MVRPYDRPNNIPVEKAETVKTAALTVAII